MEANISFVGGFAYCESRPDYLAVATKHNIQNRKVFTMLLLGERNNQYRYQESFLQGGGGGAC